jgi:hypothetical protein
MSDSQEGTRSERTGEAGSFKCSASVEYKGRKGACRRDGKHPDIDGIRWWCGLHRPDRKAKAKPEPKVEVVRTATAVSAKPKVTHQPAPEADGKIVDNSVLISASQAQVADSVAIEALEEARSALIEISNTNTAGWTEAVPVDNYKVIISHMADRAREASDKLTDRLRQLRS